MQIDVNMMENIKMVREKAKVNWLYINFLTIRIYSKFYYLLFPLFYFFIKLNICFFVGIEYYANRCKYEGEWKNGNKEGKGKLNLCFLINYKILKIPLSII